MKARKILEHSRWVLGSLCKNSIFFLTNAYPDFDSSYRGIFIKKMAELLHADGYEFPLLLQKFTKEPLF